jgi:hypothetical protein
MLMKLTPVFNFTNICTIILSPKKLQSQTVTSEKVQKTLLYEKVGEIDTLGQFHQHVYAKLSHVQML